MKMKKYYIGVDVGSISTNVAIIDEHRNVIETVYIRTEGKPIASVQRGIQIMREKLLNKYQKSLEISGAGATGSARELTGVIIGADVVRNEITAHSLASLHVREDIQTVIDVVRDRGRLFE